MQWQCLSFHQLTALQLYRILQLRSEVFVLEQHCLYQDADNKDIAAHHFMGWEEDTLVAYTRLLPPGISYTEASIGRVITSPAHRRTGSGKLLMEKSIEQCRLLFGDVPIRIGAQLYLKKFYEGFGFIVTSDVYLEDNIEHIEMILQ